MSQLDDRRLEAALREALGPPYPVPTGSKQAEDSLARILATVAQRRRRRHYTSAVALCIVLLGALLYTKSDSTQPKAALSSATRLDAFEDPIQLATYLIQTASASGNGGSDCPWLREDAEAREKVLGYLDHQYSAVRRAAASALATCDVRIPTEKLVHLLVEEDEQVETPIELADSGDSSAVLASALAGRRRSTILFLLGAIRRQSYGYLEAQGPVVEPAALTPFLDENDAGIRRETLFTLQANPAFEVGAKVRALLAEDPDPGVRQAAAFLIKDKLGEAGLEELLAHLYTETAPKVERILIGSIKHLPDALELARLKLDRRDSAEDVLVLYAEVLLHHGDHERGIEELRRAFREGGDHAIYQAASIARKLESPGDLRAELRDELQAAWERLPATERRLTTTAILTWDLLRGDEAAMLSALALADRAGLKNDLLVAHAVGRYLESEFEAVRAAASSLLERWRK